MNQSRNEVSRSTVCCRRHGLLRQEQRTGPRGLAWFLCVLCVLCGENFGLALPATASGAAGAPWWDDYPIAIETADVAEAQRYHASMALCADHNDPGWGIYGQKVSEAPERTAAFHAAGIKAISYFETFGQTIAYIAELGPQAAGGLTPIRSTHWSWQQYGGGPIAWIGIHNYWSDDAFARPFTYTHPRYGSRRLTYPDGTIAGGYDGVSTDPRNSRVLLACCSKDILGNLAVSYERIENVNAIDPLTGMPRGPLDGLIAADGGYAGHLSFGKDSACPYWIDYTYASALLAAEQGADGMWTDNYGPWDSFGWPPLKIAFGDWSVAGFRAYLKNHFSQDALLAMDVSDADGFDIRAALRAKAAEWGAGADLENPVWLDARWLDCPLWRAYVIYKRQTGAAALENYYAAVKRAAADAGKPEFLVAGNDIPLYSLGWVRGALDVVSTEMTAGWHMGTGSRGVLLPPAGRFGPLYKLAREHAQSRLVSVWFYVEPRYYAKPGIACAGSAGNGQPVVFVSEYGRLSFRFQLCVF